MKLYLPLLLTAAHAFTPELSPPTPSGVTRDTEPEIHLSGKRLDDFQDIIFYQPGISMLSSKIENPENVVVKLHVAADAPIGEHPFRIHTRSGISYQRYLEVNQFLIVDEVEPNNKFDNAQKISNNTTIHGVVKNEDEDYYCVTLKKGERLTAEVEAMRLGSEFFDAYVAIINDKKFELAACDDVALLRTDCTASIIAPEDGDYRIVVREAAYEGNDNCRYRLHLTQAPRPRAVIPCGGKPGETINFTFLGDPIVNITQSITLPNFSNNSYPLFCTENNLSSPSAIPIVIAPLESITETEVNDHLGKQNRLPAFPCAAHGVIDHEKDQDLFQFTAKKDQTLIIKCLARTLRSSLDAVLSIHAADDAVKASNDDKATGNLDPVLTWTCPADGEYFVKIRDQLSSFSPTHTYRLEFTEKTSSITATMPVVDRDQSQKRKIICVPRGNKFATPINYSRDNANGEIAVSSQNLPQRVSMQAPIVPGGLSNYPILFEAAADAPLAATRSDFILTINRKDQAPLIGNIGERIEHIEVTNQGSFQGTSSDKICVAAIEEAPVHIELVPSTIPIVKNGKKFFKVKINRHGYDDALTLRYLWSPPGITSPITLDVPKGANEADYEINASNDAAIGKFPAIIQAEIPTPRGEVLIASNMAEIQIAEPYLSMNLDLCASEQGKATAMLAHAEIATPFEGNATATLMGLPHGVTAQPVSFNKDQKEITFPIQIANDAPVGKHNNIFVQVMIPFQDGQILHNLATGTIRIDAPLVAKAPPPAPVATAEKKPETPAPAVVEKPLSRLEQLRQTKK